MSPRWRRRPIPGRWLIEYMRDRSGLTTLDNSDILDFGCGSRFADATVNRDIAIRSYVGIDVFKKMIDSLNAKVRDPRLSFAHFNAFQRNYNPEGEPMSASTHLAVGDR